MKTILRTKYFRQLIGTIGTPDIKVITGIRRSGKSELLKQFRAYIETHLAESNIIQFDLSLNENADLLNRASLYQAISSQYQPGQHNFLLIDEVQLCEGFEPLFSGLHAEQKYDIYLTGSNAFLLSSDLATLFTGRTYEIKVFPFSLAEYMQYFDLTDPDQALPLYYRDGGMAGSYNYADPEFRTNYLVGVYQSMIIRDVVQRHKIRQKQQLDDISNYLMDNIGNLTSVRGISGVVSGSQTDPTSLTTNSNYVKYLCEAFAFERIGRYDVKGKKYLAPPDKFYLTDHSFRRAVLGNKELDFGRVYENIVAIDLLRKGYEIYVGNGRNYEVDFVAISGNAKLYIQVSDNISDQDTLKRELTPLLSIPDNYPKILLANTHHPTYQVDGVQIINLADWLASDNNGTELFSTL